MARIISMLVLVLVYTSCKLGDVRTNNFYYSTVSLNKGYKHGYNQMLYFVNDSLFFYKYHKGTGAEISCGIYKIREKSITLYPFEENKNKAIYSTYEDSINIGFINNRVIFNNDILIPRRRKKSGAYKDYPPKDVINQLMKGE